MAVTITSSSLIWPVPAVDGWFSSPEAISAPAWAAIGVGIWLVLLMVTVAIIHAARRGDSQAAQLIRLSRVDALMDALRIRDEPTGRHSGRVADLVAAVAEDVGLPHGDLRVTVQAAALHDLGKLRVPDAILHKPAALTPAEWSVIRRHPDWGAEVVARTPEISHLALIVRTHHEHYDGGGYPGGLSGAAIPLGARIVAVCDAFDAMIHDRPHRPAVPVQRAIAELRANAGNQFDPEVVDALERALRSGRLAGAQESLVV